MGAFKAGSGGVPTTNREPLQVRNRVKNREEEDRHTWEAALRMSDEVQDLGMQHGTVWITGKLATEVQRPLYLMLDPLLPHLVGLCSSILSITVHSF